MSNATAGRKYFSSDSKCEGRNDPGGIARRRSNFSACKKRCNAVMTPVIVAPLRIVDRDGKPWSRQNLYNASLMLVPYFCVRYRTGLSSMVVFASFRSKCFYAFLSLKPEWKPISCCGWRNVWNSFRGDIGFRVDSRCSIRYQSITYRNTDIRMYTHRKCRFFDSVNRMDNFCAKAIDIRRKIKWRIILIFLLFIIYNIDIINDR